MSVGKTDVYFKLKLNKLRVKTIININVTYSCVELVNLLYGLHILNQTDQ